MPLPHRLISGCTWFILSPCAVPHPCLTLESLPCCPAVLPQSVEAQGSFCWIVFVYPSSSWLSSPTETDSHFSGVTPLTSWLDQMLDSDSVVILRKPALAAQALSRGLGYLWQTDLRSISLFHEDPPPPEAWESIAAVILGKWFLYLISCSLTENWGLLIHTNCTSKCHVISLYRLLPLVRTGQFHGVTGYRYLQEYCSVRFSLWGTPTLSPIPQRPGSEAIIRPSLCPTCLPCPAFQGTLTVQLCSGLRCACGMSPGSAPAPSLFLLLPNAPWLPHLERQGSWGCYIFLFSSRYQQLQELWPSTSCQKGLQPAPITQPTVGLGWESPDLGVTWQGQGPVDFIACRALWSVDSGFRSSLQKLFFMAFLRVPSLAF